MLALKSSFSAPLEENVMIADPKQQVSELYAGRNAIVMGGTSGIGAATAELLAERGAKLTIVGRREDLGEALATRCRAVGPGALFVRADIRDYSQVEHAVAVAQQQGPLTMAANCAGVDLPSPIADMSESDFDKLFSINTKGMWNCLKAELEVMKSAGGGSIVNVGSIASLVPVANNAAYCASKAAVASFTRSAAHEYASVGIRVNCVAPGTTKTKMLQDWLTEVEAAGNTTAQSDLEQAAALGYLSTPREQAATIVFLLSDEAAYVTGATLVVDGGLTMLTRLPDPDGGSS